MSELDDFQFVNDLSEEYQCHICLSLLDDPHLTTCCGHHFCKNCIFKVAQANQACPMCKAEGFVAVVDKNVHRKIRALPVYCQFRGKGCEWQGEFRELEQHLDPVREHCKFNAIVCSKGCGQTVLRSHLEAHLLKECPNRDQECQHCNLVMLCARMQVHIETECTQIPIACPNGCTEQVLRGDALKHVEVCPMRLVRCRFSEFGCNLQLQLQEVRKHMEEFSEKHLFMIAECSSKQKKDSAKMKAQLSHLEGCLLQKEKEVAHLKKELSLQQQNTKKCLLQQEKQFQEKIDQLELMLNSMNIPSRFEDVQHRIMILETQVPVPPYYFTVSNFTLHKQGNTQWTCPSFFSRVGGYKMAIEVSANGEGVGRNTHVSVYIRIMHGEYDDMLRWPLRASVTIQLISQSGNEAHYEMTTPQYEWAQVTSGMIGAGWGWDKFIQHSDLDFNPVRRTEYLRNDRLNFRVICVDESL